MMTECPAHGAVAWGSSMARTRVAADGKKARPLFAHNRRDGILVAITGAQLALIAWGVMNFRGLSFAGLTFLFVACVVLSVTHFEVVVHYFIHTPYFSSKLLNSLYGAVASIPVMEPCALFGIAHMEHHRYGNDAKDPVSGTTRDSTSTYQYSDTGHEPLWRYALLSPLREWTNVKEPYDIARHSHARQQIAIEAATLAAFWIALIAVDWRFAAFYLLVVYVSQAGACLQNYFEHYGATPADKMANSVSCYGRLYNLLWFNNGYHQEHHYRPAVHWTKVKDLRREMLPEDRRRVVKWAHFTNLPGLSGTQHLFH
jgi:fatty acid desaturase